MDTSNPIVVARPPDLPRAAPTNLVVRLLPVVMIVAGAGMAAVYFTSGGAARSPATLLFPAMMLVSAVGSLAHAARGGSRAELDEDRRDYLTHLDEIDDLAATNAAAQLDSSRRSEPDPDALWTLAGTTRQWERLPGTVDFGRMRVGLGPQPLCTPLVAPELGEVGARDPVTMAALDRVLTQWSTVAALPITVDVAAHAVLSPVGEIERARAAVRAMVCQLATFHHPDHVEIGAIVTRQTAPRWDWLKWLPHHRHTVGDSAAPTLTAVHTVVVLDGPTTWDALPSGSGAPAALTILCVGEVPGDLHHLDCVRLDGTDELSETQAVRCARRLARSAGAAPRYELPATAWRVLLDTASPKAAWRSRTAAQLLRVPIGVADGGAPVELDLKEGARGGMGPHGLCVGATGSGKSEFLRSLALGLVATHPPELLNLVLVDFKGGATFLGFERVPHVAAVITNLAAEAHLVARMGDALAGELTRRQELLRTAGNVSNVFDYRAVWRRDSTLPALPTLFVVVDEFSELLSHHAELVDLFVAIGRLGRSLGVHLLLSSQRLEEGRLRGLESHLSYRVCLKTFSTNESRAVLGSAAAYELPNEPGAAYLKDASGEVVRFRAHHASVPVPLRATVDEADPPLVVAPFTAAPGRVRRAAPQPASRRTELDAALDLVAGRGTPAHRLWLPPMAAPPTLGALCAQIPSGGPLTVPIGLMDNAFEQRRLPLCVDLRGAGGHVAVVGGPRSGKSTTLQTLALALAVTQSPTAVALYGLDFGGGALSELRPLPHVGAVAGPTDRELAARIVARVRGVVRRRELAGRRGRRADDDPYGDVFLVIDGWATARQEFDWLEEMVTSIAAQGLSVRVHVVVAAARWAELRPALKDQLGTRVELRLGDPAESEFDRQRARVLARRPAGHGITSDGLEMVIATPTLSDADESWATDDSWAATARLLGSRHPTATAPPVHALPTVVAYDGLGVQAAPHVLLGLGGDDVAPVAVDFTTCPHVLVIGEMRCGKTATLRTVCREVLRTDATAEIVIIDPRRTLLGVIDEPRLRAYAVSPADAETHLRVLAGHLGARLPDATVTQRQLRDRTWWSGPDVYVVIDDYELVASVTNPLTVLLDLLPFARDVGLHLVVARGSGGAARAMFDPVLTALRDGDALGLVMSGGPEEGALLGSVRPTPLPPGRAAIVRRGRADGHVQVAWTDTP